MTCKRPTFSTVGSVNCCLCGASAHAASELQEGTRLPLCDKTNPSHSLVEPVPALRTLHVVDHQDPGALSLSKLTLFGAGLIRAAGKGQAAGVRPAVRHGQACPGSHPEDGPGHSWQAGLCLQELPARRDCLDGSGDSHLQVSASGDAPRTENLSGRLATQVTGRSAYNHHGVLSMAGNVGCGCG